jgi:hypothetical protein
VINLGDESRGPKSVQSAVKSKISEYPERARKNMHSVRVRVPVAVAQVPMASTSRRKQQRQC